MKLYYQLCDLTDKIQKSAVPTALKAKLFFKAGMAKFVHGGVFTVLQI